MSQTYYCPDAPRLGEGDQPTTDKPVNDPIVMNPTTMSLPQVAGNGFVGILSSTFAVATTFQDQIEGWTRLACSMVGLVIALITLFRLIANKPNTKKQ